MPFYFNIITEGFVGSTLTDIKHLCKKKNSQFQFLCPKTNYKCSTKNPTFFHPPLPTFNLYFLLINTFALHTV